MMRITTHKGHYVRIMARKSDIVYERCAYRYSNGIDDRTIIINSRFIFTSNYDIRCDYPMFERRVDIVKVEHPMFCCTGCIVHCKKKGRIKYL
jgi:hypothetical protein